MKNNEAIRIAIAETSVIIRGGLTAALKRLPNVKVQPIELLSVEALSDCLRTQYPEMLIVNPTFGDYFDVNKFREETAGKKIRLIALVSSFVDASLLTKYDESISIFDDLDILSKKIHGLLNLASEEEELDNQETLSQREKEIVICVVKGMTNKEIAENAEKSITAIKKEIERIKEINVQVLSWNKETIALSTAITSHLRRISSKHDYNTFSDDDMNELISLFNSTEVLSKLIGKTIKGEK